MEIIVTIIIGAVTTIISGSILFFVQRYFNQQSKREEKRDKIKSKEYSLIMKSINALGKLTVANTVALRDGKTNGDLSSALKEYEKVEKELYNHLISVYTDEQG